MQRIVTESVCHLDVQEATGLGEIMMIIYLAGKERVITIEPPADAVKLLFLV